MSLYTTESYSPPFFLIRELVIIFQCTTKQKQAREQETNTHKKESQSANRPIVPIIDAAFPLWTVTQGVE